jgi:hypothetical protein
MDGSKTVTAGFSQLYTLSVAKTGDGGGTVTGSGIHCGADCTETYPPGTTVTLTATASAGSQFTGWTGAGCSGTGTCTVTMDGSKTVTAGFTLLYTLTVNRTGAGVGTVTGPGINCGADCTETYLSGTTVTLTATPDAGSQFTGWTGACTGTGTCTVTMTEAWQVNAKFALL